MKHLLAILLLSTVGYSLCSIYQDQTIAALNSKQPMFYACALGYNLRPGVLQNGQWVRQGSFNQATLDQIRNVTFPTASQTGNPKLRYINSLQNIAADAYVGGSSWDTSGPNNMCPAHGYVMGS
jgi:hypothetical protein